MVTSTAIQQLQDTYSAEPFQPFALHLQDGRKVPVWRRQSLQFTETACKVVVTQPNGWVDTISVVDVLGIGAADVETLAAYAQERPVAIWEEQLRSDRRRAGRLRRRYLPWTSPLKASLALFVLAVFVLMILTFCT